MYQYIAFIYLSRYIRNQKMTIKKLIRSIIVHEFKYKKPSAVSK